MGGLTINKSGLFHLTCLLDQSQEKVQFIHQISLFRPFKQKNKPKLTVIVVSQRLQKHQPHYLIWMNHRNKFD